MSKKLSIAVITMNRSKQLEEALKSCLCCHLPENTEFVIVDNASTDDTDVIVRSTLESSGYTYYYEKMQTNLGVGAGRNYAYSKTSGDIVYVLDDDAVIDYENNPDFFLDAIKIFDSDSRIVTLTTQIYDTAWQKNRVEINGRKIAEGLYSCLMFCGGSHFLRKEFYPNEPYLSNKYGYEEIPPSLKAIDAKKLNVFASDLLIIHKPLVDKWSFQKKENTDFHIKAFSIQFAIKSMMYPKIFLPVLKLARNTRIKKYLKNVEDAKKKVKASAKQFKDEYTITQKIKFVTVFKMFKEFKFSIF